MGSYSGGFLKQSTAVTLRIGPFVDKTDGFTPETALTITAAETFLSKNGGTLTAKNEATALAHDAGGVYSCLLDATDTNTLGKLAVFPVDGAAEHRPFMVEFMVVPANVWDSLFGASLLQVDVTQILTAAVSTAAAQLGVNMVSGSSGAITATVVAADAIGDAELAADAVTAIANAIKDALQDRTHVGTLQAGAASTATLATGASSSDDNYNEGVLIVISAAGVVQVAQITDYVGATRVATISPNWTTTPDSTYRYIVVSQ